MPRTPHFKVAPIAELFRQLEYAPPETRTRQMDATERLIADIDPLQNYPEDFITFRITGYRSDRADEPATLVGEALLPDLVNLVLLLSRNLRLPIDYANRQALTPAETSARLQVSSKSIQRYRRQGLVFHYAQAVAGKPMLVCFEDSLQRFTTGHRVTLEHAGSYSRMNRDIETAIVIQARQLRSGEHLSLNQAARRLAADHGRAHETVRQLLRRHDRRSKSPVFQESGPIRSQQVEFIYRAWRFGIESEAIAGRLGKSKATIHRAVNRRRAELLSKLDLSFIALPTFELPDAASVILSAPEVSKGLNQCFLDELTIAEWIKSLSKAPAKPDRTIDTILAGYNFLKMRAGDDLKLLGRSPSSEALDLIETSLRWATMLKRLLLVKSLPVALRRIEQNLHKPLPQQSIALIRQAVTESLRIASRTIERIDPGRDQQLDRMVSQAMDRSLARKPISEDTLTIVARASPDFLMLGDHFDQVLPWRWLSLPRQWRSRMAALHQEQSFGELAVRAVTRRWGWDGGPPQTVAAVAKALKITPIGAVRLLRRAEVHLRRS